MRAFSIALLGTFAMLGVYAIQDQDELLGKFAVAAYLITMAIVVANELGRNK